MRTFFLILLACIFSTLASAQLAGVKHVIVIGVDGMSPDGIAHANTPNMDYLMQNGSYTLKDKAVLPTTSSPNWASMMMGAGPELHGVTSNDWQHNKQTIKFECMGKDGKGHDSKMWPTFYGVLREQKPDAKIYCFHDWVGYGRLVEKGVCNQNRGPGLYGLIFRKGNNVVTRRALRKIKKKQFDFMFVHFDHVDEAGHKHGHGTKEYYDAVAYADVLIGRIINALRKAGIEKETIILVTADHGGKGKGHCGNSPEEVNVPWIFKGPAVKAGFKITSAVKTIDTAETLAHIFKLTFPECWRGKVVNDIFLSN